MEFLSSIFPSTDNPYKFLFVGGLLLIAFAIIYPIERENEIDLEIVLYNKEANVINNEIEELRVKVDKEKALSRLIIDKIDSLKSNNGGKGSQILIDQLKNDFNKTYKGGELSEKLTEISTKSLILEYEQKRIKVLQKHARKFRIIGWVLLVFGSISTLFGGYKWLNRFKKDHIVSDKKSELELWELQNRVSGKQE
ncbi:hypothetical protein QWY31_11810 [Cytophagales bacterium LB-30]|uniref:Uncharacterized protein n=1 Tax=Shiella aurantiaca TaxID=3058365 RepID=A0ABT8F725_9BACT|nr:hypothetical protein [Shiella aurantiaca]MDN4166193.1 hypothetical protein [Shiella aurantiaca]